MHRARASAPVLGSPAVRCRSPFRRRTHARRPAAGAHMLRCGPDPRGLHGRVRRDPRRARARAVARAARDARDAAGPAHVDRPEPRPRRSVAIAVVAVGAAAARAAGRERRHRPRARAPAARRMRCTSRSSATSGGGRSRYLDGEPDRRSSRPPTRSTCRSAGRSILTLQVRRRDPQLLGAEPARQEGPDPRPHRDAAASAPTRPGVYRGQCAEFCGLQHAQHGASW